MFISVRKDPNISIPATKMPFLINLGFMALDHFSTHYQFEDWKIKFDGMFAAKLFGSEKIILVKPQTYMNLSGTCIAKFKLFSKLVTMIYLLFTMIST